MYLVCTYILNLPSVVGNAITFIQLLNLVFQPSTSSQNGKTKQTSDCNTNFHYGEIQAGQEMVVLAGSFYFFPGITSLSSLYLSNFGSSTCYVCRQSEGIQSADL